MFLFLVDIILGYTMIWKLNENVRIVYAIPDKLFRKFWEEDAQTNDCIPDEKEILGILLKKLFAKPFYFLDFESGVWLSHHFMYFLSQR